MNEAQTPYQLFMYSVYSNIRVGHDNRGQNLSFNQITALYRKRGERKGHSDQTAEDFLFT